MYLFYCLKGFVQSEKAACPEITDKDIKELGRLSGFF